MAMHCIKCGSALPPEVARCPTCGASTPYNVNTPTPVSAGEEERGEGTLMVAHAEATPSSPASRHEESQPSSDWQEYQSTSEPLAPESEAPRFNEQAQAGSAQPLLETQRPQPLPVQQEVQRRDSSLARPLALILLAFIVIGGSLVAYSVFVGRPAEFHAQATAIAQAILTPTSPNDIYISATSGKPSINDPLSSPNHSTWSQSGASDNGCTFSSGAFHLSMSGTNFVMQCFSNSSRLNNFAFQVQMTIDQGSGGGLTFRVDDAQSSFYDFSISTNGFYELDLVNSNRLVKILNYGPSLAIKAGLNQPNLLAVIAHGNNIFLYVNKQYVGTVQDSTYSSGSIGLFAYKANTISGDVAFSNAQVWKL